MTVSCRITNPQTLAHAYLRDNGSIPDAEWAGFMEYLRSTCGVRAEYVRSTPGVRAEYPCRFLPHWLAKSAEYSA